MRVLGLVGVAGLVLGSIGGSGISTADSQGDLDDANRLRHIGIILFVALYACVVLATAFCWLMRKRILKYRRQVGYYSTYSSALDRLSDIVFRGP